MIGPFVPLVMIPRFTSYVGEGSYTTVPLNVEPYKEASLTFWRGPLLGASAGATFATYFEESHDAEHWVECAVAGATQPITGVDTHGLCTVSLKRRWFRMRIELTPDSNDLVAITCWAGGGFERRVPGV